MKPQIDSRVEDEICKAVALSSAGKKPNWNTLIDLIYDRLKTTAQNIVGYQEGNPSLGPTALVNETFLKFATNARLADINDCQHFFALFVLMMRQTFVDYCRKKKLLKRGGEYACTEFDIVIDSLVSQTCEFDELQEILDVLAQRHPRASQALHMQMFLSMTVKEIALALEVSNSCVDKDLRFAKAIVKKILLASQSSANEDVQVSRLTKQRIPLHPVN